MTDADKLRCAIEALTVIEGTAPTPTAVDWYQRWKPDYMETYGLPTTERSSLKCFISEHALALIAPDVQTWHSHMRDLRTHA